MKIKSVIALITAGILLISCMCSCSDGAGSTQDDTTVSVTSVQDNTDAEEADVNAAQSSTDAEQTNTTTAQSSTDAEQTNTTTAQSSTEAEQTNTITSQSSTDAEQTNTTIIVQSSTDAEQTKTTIIAQSSTDAEQTNTTIIAQSSTDAEQKNTTTTAQSSTEKKQTETTTAQQNTTEEVVVELPTNEGGTLEDSNMIVTEMNVYERKEDSSLVKETKFSDLKLTKAKEKTDGKNTTIYTCTYDVSEDADVVYFSLICSLGGMTDIVLGRDFKRADGDGEFRTKYTDSDGKVYPFVVSVRF